MSQKLITIVRHGETDANKQYLLHGWSDHELLNEKGREQVALLGKRLSTEPIDYIACSTLKRAVQTAQAVADAHAVAQGLSEPLPLHKFPELREICFGEWEGTSWHPATPEGERFSKLFQEWEKGCTVSRAPGGESPAEVISRAVPVLQSICSDPNIHHPVVVVHGRMLRIVLASILHIPIAEIRPGNTAVNVLSWNGEAFSPVLLNCTAHCTPTSQPLSHPLEKGS
ncbi:histidine phosphatase family protein [Pelomyxa schiedti]|nr:histidine phosphatase family protein [Pelomyxa schiedti]